MCSASFFAPAVAGHWAIPRSVHLSVPWRSCLGYRHAGCLQFNQLADCWSFPGRTQIHRESNCRQRGHIILLPRGDNLFSYFFTIPVWSIISKSAKFSGCQNYVDYQTGISFLIPQGTVPWHPISVGFIHRPTWCNASAVLAMPSVCLSICVCHKSVFYQKEWMD